jgi:hypothetical protein
MGSTLSTAASTETYPQYFSGDAPPFRPFLESTADVA